jgi:hypothetical protein
MQHGKPRKHQKGGTQVASGIGVYCQLQDPTINTSIFIQASVPVTPSAL